MSRSRIVYCANGHDVETTIVDGRILMGGRKVLAFDEASVIEEAMEAAERVLGRWRMSVTAWSLVDCPLPTVVKSRRESRLTC